MLPWVLCVLLSIFLLLLLGKVRLMQKSMEEIRIGLGERLSTDTNNLLFISSRDRYVRQLASALNSQLQLLRGERRRFQQGDLALKNAVAGISHDLRTPLTAILGYLDLLEQEELGENARRYLTVIQDRTQLLKQLIEEFFRYALIRTSEAEAVQKEPLDLNQVLESSIAAFYAVLKERRITPVIHMPEKKVLRTLDRSSLTRVFSNLLSNAVKYSDGDLEITLSETGEIAFSNTASRLSGIEVKRLFDRFYTAQTADNATGLGLAIARTLVQQMGGEIWADFTGKRLTIRLFFAE